MVPKELVAALLATRGASRTVPEIVVGRLPPNLPFEVPPPDSGRLVGSLAHSSSGTLVFAVPQQPIDAMRAYERVVNAAGWHAPRSRPGGGFRSPDAAFSGFLCRGERESLSLSAVERQQGGSFLQIHYWKPDGGSPCAESRRDGPPFQRGPIPTLYPPDGTTMMDGGSSGGGRGYAETYARLKTALQPAQLVAHYGAQVRAEGWSLQFETATQNVSAQTWRMEDRDGRVWIGLLLAHALPGSDDRDLLFRVVPRTLEPMRRP